MSKKQRVLTIRPSDEMIVEAFEISLAQLGVFARKHERLYPYFTIIGNKSDGMVTVEAGKHLARVYVVGKGEIFTYVDHIVFDAINNVKLGQPKSVQLHNFDHRDIGSHIETVLTRYADQREANIRQILGLAYGYGLASAVLTYLWKYPHVELGEQQDEYRLVYEFEKEICCVKKIELVYSRTYGYVEAVINSSRYFLCEHFSEIWSEHIASKP
jgi:hypothetical protein